MSEKKKEAPPPPQKFPHRIVEYDGFKLYAGACNHCPKDVTPWIYQFCHKKENNWFSLVQIDYALDIFNCYGFDYYVPNLLLAKEMICDRHCRLWSYITDEDVKAIHDQAKILYGLLHAKWICTIKGLSQMKRKIIKKERYGQCPRVCCKQNALMPVGISPVPNRHGVKLYCSRCSDIYNPPSHKKYDGAFFGPAFPATFLITYPDRDYRYSFKKFPYQIFGFRLSPKGGMSPEMRALPHSTNNHRDDLINDETAKK
ncbi:Casein kinase II subunit beta [Tritrichomonas foetus]|uniref:Casein kinase II subunit beta n=1 Tax=Tritrichomonas foetus TaxID=1144522 RepID=A0A1J4KLT0_9EUKA|nr:Casein kinase II subunit beta [Tritrichomonas foetus]|eukprot:OHT11896.1 Casein kinase II subunit beta [Tritrichomonas foetus]